MTDRTTSQDETDDETIPGFGAITDVDGEDDTEDEGGEDEADEGEEASASGASDDEGDQAETEDAADAAGEDADPVAAADAGQSGEDAEVSRVLESMSSFDDAMARLNAAAQAISEEVNLDPMAYKSDADYQQALAKAAARDYQMRQLQAQYDQIEKDRHAAREYVWQQQTASARTRHKDFDDVLAGAKFKPSSAMAEAILSTPKGAEIAYHLAKNPQIGAKLARMSPLAVALEIGRMESKFGTQAKPQKAVKPKAKPVSKAPPPPPVSPGSRSAPKVRSIEDMSFAELKRGLYN